MKNRCLKCESMSEDIESCLDGLLDNAKQVYIMLKELGEASNAQSFCKMNGIITLARRLKEIEKRRFEFENFVGLDEDFMLDIEGNRYTGPKIGC